MAREDVKVRRESFGERDSKGRELGAIVYTWEDGDAYHLQTHATRGGQKFGAWKPGRVFTGNAAREVAIAKYLEGARKRARKLASEALEAAAPTAFIAAPSDFECPYELELDGQTLARCAYMTPMADAVAAAQAMADKWQRQVVLHFGGKSYEIEPAAPGAAFKPSHELFDGLDSQGLFFFWRGSYWDELNWRAGGRGVSREEMERWGWEARKLKP